MGNKGPVSGVCSQHPMAWSIQNQQLPPSQQIHHQSQPSRQSHHQRRTAADGQPSTGICRDHVILQGDNPPCEVKSTLLEPAREQGTILIVESIVFCLISSRPFFRHDLHQYGDLLHECCGLGATPSVIDHPMPTLEG